MSKRMKRSLPYLQVMAMCKPKLRKMLVAHAPSDVVMAICECALNLLKGVIPLTLRQKECCHVTRHISVLWQIKKCPKSEKENTLVKKEGVY